MSKQIPKGTDVDGDMTQEQQRIAIAEACGWRGRDHHPRGILSDTGVYKVYSKKG